MPSISTDGEAAQFAAFGLDEFQEFILAGQFQLILRHEEAVVHRGERILHQRVILAGAKQQADRRVIAFAHHVFAIPGDIGVELAEVLEPVGTPEEMRASAAERLTDELLYNAGLLTCLMDL